jgi:hypothetical protein
MQHTAEILTSTNEFFTIAATGESAISIRGLARLSGIPQKTVSRWFESDLSHDGVPEELKPLASKPLYMSHLSGEIKVRGKVIKPIRAAIATKIISYAAFKLGKPVAIEALESFLEIGLQSYIQGVNGWLPFDYQEASLEPRYRISRVMAIADPWERLYDAKCLDRIRSWYFPRDFFWKFAYAFLSQEEVAFLNQCNPVLESTWQRKSRIFQHFTEETRSRLEPEVVKLCIVIETSTCRQDFEARWSRINGADQKELRYA